MSHARCEHGSIGDLCPQCNRPRAVKSNNVVPFPASMPAPSVANSEGLSPPPVAKIVARTLAGAFIDARYDALRRAFERFTPFEAAALAVSVHEALPPDEKDNWTAFVRRMAEP